MSKMPLMECGHVAQSRDSKTHEPCCVICLGINPGAKRIDKRTISLEGRKSRCSSCGGKGGRYSTYPGLTDSSFDLPFFEYCGPGSRCNNGEGVEFDRHYCGCRGWS